MVARGPPKAKVVGSSPISVADDFLFAFRMILSLFLTVQGRRGWSGMVVVYVGACILVDGLITAAGMWNIETYRNQVVHVVNKYIVGREHSDLLLAVLHPLDNLLQ